MKVLFIGGTGRLSKDVAFLAAEKNEVYLLTRGTSDRLRFVFPQYHMIYCDIRNDIKCKEKLRNLQFDVVVDFLSYKIDDLKNKLSILKGKFMQYIFISSATVYCPLDDEIISESKTTVGNSKWQYAYSKYLCENYLREYCEQDKSFFYTIVRPYVTYGNTRVPYPLVPRDIRMEWSLVDRIVRKKTIVMFDNGTTVTTLTHAKDFAKGIIGLFGNEKAFGEAFHITESNTTSWEEVLNIMGSILQCEVYKKNIDKELIYKFMPEYKTVLEGDKARNMRFDNSKIKAVVPEFDCSIPLEKGLEDMIDFYKANEDLRKIDEDWNHRMDILLECTV